MDDRHSTVDLSETDDQLITDAHEIADREARNGLLQFDEIRRLVQLYSAEKSLPFTVELVQNLNRIAIEGIRRSAGAFRNVAIHITNTAHVPPQHKDVPRLVSQMCTYVESNWNYNGDDIQSAIHLAAYLMWRLNWIHPFRDGNGRTSRAVSYLVLSVRLGTELAGSPTIADQIVDNRQPYYSALDQADSAWRRGVLDVSAMETLLQQLLLRQLQSAVT